jgi:hypothetical protein
MVEAIHINKRLALTECGLTVPITTLLDCDGEETNDPREAVAFVAGDVRTGWEVALISDYCSIQTLN